MDQDHPRRRRRHRRFSGEDRISGLPDELLHSILLRLGSVRAAARTGALSRRWRRVWTHLPELVFDSGSFEDAPPPAPASFARAVDDALAAYATDGPDTTLGLEGLVIVVPTAAGGDVPAGRVARWLRFAAGRVAGELVLFMPRPRMPPDETEAVLHRAALELPACERAKTIALRLNLGWRLRLRPAGAFAALTSLTILFARMDGGEVTALVCTRCPRLRNLRLGVVLVGDRGISIRSGSLRSLSLSVARTRRLEVATPGLEYLYVVGAIGEARVSAPKLAGLVWSCATYDPHRHRFEDAGRRRLQLLDVGETSAAAVMLMQKFDGVDQLRLGVCIPPGVEAYKSFLKDTTKLPKCQTQTLSITIPWSCHGLAPVMLHLLRRCSSTKKVSVQMFDLSSYSSWLRCPSYCPCRLEESRRIDGIDLNSLEEVEITSYRGSQEDLLELDRLTRDARLFERY